MPDINAMNASSLPEKPDLAQERKRAKDLLKALRSHEGDAIARFSSHHPRFVDLTPDARVTQSACRPYHRLTGRAPMIVIRMMSAVMKPTHAAASNGGNAVRNASANDCLPAVMRKRSGLSATCCTVPLIVDAQGMFSTSISQTSCQGRLQLSPPDDMPARTVSFNERTRLLMPTEQKKNI